MFAGYNGAAQGSCGVGAASATNGGAKTPCLNPADFSPVILPSSATTNAPIFSFGNQRRNQFFGPGYFDTDFTVMKYTSIPHWESGKLGIGFQFFNILNHPNFDQPVRDISNGVRPVRPDFENGQHPNQHSGFIPRRRRCPALDPVDGKA